MDVVVTGVYYLNVMVQLINHEPTYLFEYMQAIEIFFYHDFR